MKLRRYSTLEIRVLKRDTPSPWPMFIQLQADGNEWVSLPELVGAIEVERSEPVPPKRKPGRPRKVRK